MATLSEIHPTACIDPDAQVGEGCVVGPFAVIEAGVRIGPLCRIHAHAVLKQFTRLGCANQVFEGAVLGGVPQDLKFHDVTSELQIGDRNVFREGVTVNRSTHPGGKTTIGDDNFLMAQAHVAHECVVGDRVVLANNVSLAGHVTLEDSVFLSGGVVIHQFCKVGIHAMVGGNAKVVQDVPPFCLADGVPARLRSLNLVGLKRAAFPSAEISALKRALRILGQGDLKQRQRLELLEAMNSPSVSKLSRFIRQSQRGICRLA